MLIASGRGSVVLLMYKRIFVAVDGSKESDYAFEKAMSICKRNKGAILTAIHVLDKSYRMGIAEMSDQTYFKEVTEFSEQLMVYYEEKARVFGVACELILKEGSPTSALLKEFKELKERDLVICGATNLGRIGRMLLGSVTDSLVHQSGCDVLVVRTPGVETVN